MKTYKQLIVEVDRVRQNAKAWKWGAESIQSNIPPVDSDNANKHFRAGREEAQGKKGRKGALKFTRKQRVEATKKIAEKAAKNSYS